MLWKNHYPHILKLILALGPQLPGGGHPKPGASSDVCGLPHQRRRECLRADGQGVALPS